MDAIRLLSPTGLEALVVALRARGYEVRGPVRRDGTVLFDRIESASDLAVGWRLDQGPGESRLVPADNAAEVFAAVVGPNSVRETVLPPRHQLLVADADDGRWTFASLPLPTDKVAYIGVRACDLAALAIQDRVFGMGPVPNAHYLERRRNLFLVGVDCGHSQPTCFCASVGTGPAVTDGADLRLSELDPDGDHRFLVRAITDRGAEILSGLAAADASPKDAEEAEARARQAAEQQTRRMHPDAHDVLADSLGSSHWDEIAERCLTCANCTLACPTCFCTTVEDSVSLSGDHAERWARWDSCFTIAYTHTTFGSVRESASSRYRQWLTHKLSTWVEQFGTSGCVGCGRCIAWCPVGIDLTEEVDVFAAARERDLVEVEA